MSTLPSLSLEAASRGDTLNSSINVEGDIIEKLVNRNNQDTHLSPFEQRYRAFRASIDTSIKSALPDWDEVPIGSFKQRHRDFPVHQSQIQLSAAKEQ